MIGSHNSFTFKKSTRRLFNAFKCFWRCQDKTIQEQYNAGVRFFDLRVYHKSSHAWGIAHGLVNLYGGFGTVEAILYYMHGQFPDAHFRLILEKGSDNDEEEFKDQVADAVTAFDCHTKLYEAIIKSGWKIVYHNPAKEFIIKDYCYTPILSGKSFWYNLTHFKFATIKGYAKKHNPVIIEEMITDPVTVHFMDFV